MNNVCYLIGVLDNGIDSLSATALLKLQQAEVVIAATRCLKLFSEQIAESSTCMDLTAQLTQVPTWINDALDSQKKVVVLATGDPLCYGIANFLGKKISSDKFAVLPNVSSLQLAFAKLKLSWQDASILSIHQQDTGEWSVGAGIEHGLAKLLPAFRYQDKIAILTSPENSPDRIARMLSIEGLAAKFQMSVMQDLLGVNEKIWLNNPVKTLAESEFNGNNIVILQRIIPVTAPVLFGLADETFMQRKPDKGLITKREVRAVSLAKMQLTSHSIVWDIGAGSGAVGLEAARLCSQGYVYAIEKNPADVAIASQNAQQLDVHNYQLIHAKAPSQMDAWPVADAIFIGGTGGELDSLIKLCLQNLRTNGWLVMNFVTLENLTTAVNTLKTINATWDVTQIQASRSQPILHMHRLQAENPVWIVAAQQEST